MSATEKTTPAMEQWRRMKDQHPDKIILFRMGDFYETFHEDAVKASRLLGLVLTRRGKDPASPPLAGVPHHQLERYVRELTLKGEKVAICEQLEDPALAKGVVKRGITEVATPGLTFDTEMLVAGANNYLAAVSVSGDEAALALVDVTTGEFLVTTPSAEKLADELVRYAPAEILAARESMAKDGFLANLLASGIGGSVTKRDGYFFDVHEGAARLKKQFGVMNLDGFGLDDAPLAVGAAGAVLAYLAEAQVENLPHLRPPRRRRDDDCLILDRVTVGNLELLPRSAGTRAPTLWSVMDNTLTGPGGRLLRQWLLRPLARLEPILERQEAVGELMRDGDLLRSFRDRLSGIADFERIIARVAAERAGPRDLAALARGIDALPGLIELGGRVGANLLQRCAARLDPLSDVAALIRETLVDDPPPTLVDGGVIRPGFNKELDEYHDAARGGKEWLAEYQATEQARTGIPSLKVAYNRVFGYYIEITNTHKEKAPADYVRKQTLVNAERYITPALKDHESKVLGASEKLVALEQELFRELRSLVGREVRRIQETAAKVAELDALASLAANGVERGYVLPEMHDGLDTRIDGGRHPVIETLLPAGEFVDNDLEFSAGKQRVLIITGPNMAGKSTFIRQSALLVIMAHVGSPIPARSAAIGLADRVFTRVGASDDLARGRSTFMVEMTETANILNNATERSLLILDEVGRGTSTFDGVSLAWAITEFIHNRIGARTLFATHYHELAELGSILNRAANFNVAVRDWNGEIIFLRKIQTGACDRSYGIQVGRLAGIPSSVVDRAGEILAGLEAQAAERDWKMLSDSREMLRAAAREVQLELFAPPKVGNEKARALAAELAAVDTDRLSPVDAHALLRQLSRKAKGIKK